MKITIESTPVIVVIDDGVAARRWEGATEGGIPVVAHVAGVSPQTHDEAVLARFSAELEEREPPPAQAYADRVKALSVSIARAIGPDLARLPHRRENIYAVLNAAAVAVAAVLAGCDDDPGARDFFEDALTDNLADAQREGPDAKDH